MVVVDAEINNLLSGCLALETIVKTLKLEGYWVDDGVSINFSLKAIGMQISSFRVAFGKTYCEIIFVTLVQFPLGWLVLSPDYILRLQFDDSRCYFERKYLVKDDSIGLQRYISSFVFSNLKNVKIVIFSGVCMKEHAKKLFKLFAKEYSGFVEVRYPWKSLKSITLENMTGDAEIVNLLSGCPVLETILFHKVGGFHCLEIINSLKVKSLKLEGYWMEDDGSENDSSFEIFALNLQLSHDFHDFNCRHVDVSSVVNAKDISDQDSDDDEEDSYGDDHQYSDDEEESCSDYFQDSDDDQDSYSDYYEDSGDMEEDNPDEDSDDTEED
ncbi:hypothetical protein H5410_002182 [Solanum commersonii]|uniref:F-box/LRR-repeat protein n=1 Tax=Solanum commersonii TaxID=4109 RepID=A0A9J6B191_SOLCO|nr:hypothetical protein H5410_002182 [Solanum commersonii]